MEMNPDPDAILSHPNPHVVDLLAVWEAYDRRSYWTTLLSDGGDAAAYAEQQLATAPEITALQALQANAALVERLTGPLRRDAVHAARHEGASWTTVGDALGISKQSAWAAFAAESVSPRVEADPAQPQSLLASREQAAQWRQENLDRLAEHPEITVAPVPDVPGYWSLRAPDGQDLGEEMGTVLADLSARGIRVRRPNGQVLTQFDWMTEKYELPPH